MTTLRFEEIPTVEINGFVAGRIDGECEIEIDHRGDWWISLIRVDVDNNEIGAKAKGRSLTLSEDEHPQLWFAIEARVIARYSDQIEEMVRDVRDEAREPQGSVYRLHAAE